MARLFAQGQPVINGAAADGESLVRLHFAQAAIKGRQNSQTQIHTIRFAHFNSVAQKTLRAISPFVNSTEKILLNIFTGRKEITAKNWTIWHIGAGIGLLG